MEKSRSTDFSPVKVAILDTGVNFQHCKIKDAINAERCQGFPADPKYDPQADNNGHGTQVASVLLRTSPDISLYIARVVDDAGKITSDSEVAKVRIFNFQC